MVRVKKRVNLYLILSKDIEKGVMKMKKYPKVWNIRIFILTLHPERKP